MNNKKRLQYFIKSDFEEIIKNYSPLSVAESLGFENGMIFAYQLLYSQDWRDDMQIFSIDLLNTLRKIYSEKWDEDWRNDVFLGTAYGIVIADDSHYDEKYSASLRAFNKVKSPPAELLIALAECCDGPGQTPVSYEQACKWLEQSFREKPYAEAASAMALVYALMGKPEEKEKWKSISEKLDQEGKNAPQLVPMFITKWINKNK